jgi:hypothetical protein
MMKQERTMYTADQVWACAVAAQRINGEYLKEPVWGPSDSGEDRMIKDANKLMVKQWLRTENYSLVTAADHEQGREMRNYFNGYLLKQISGKINDFESTALRIAQMDEFTGKHLLEFAVISCLPSVMLRDQDRRDLKDAINGSTQLEGEVGDKIQGMIDVFRCDYQQAYNKFKVQARLGDSFVNFWYGSRLEGAVTIRAKIKAQRGDNTTQLNFVKVIS